MTRMFPYRLKSYSMMAQVVIAVIFSVLNFGISVLCNRILVLPLFMDMIFVYSATFFGLPCGILCSILYHLMDLVFITGIVSKFLYVICSLTGVLLCWALTVKGREVSIMKLFLILFISTVIISIEGSIIYSIFFTKFSTEDFQATVFLTYQLVIQDLPLQLAAFFSRLPVNLVDKMIAISSGFALHALLAKKLRNVSEN